MFKKQSTVLEAYNVLGLDQGSSLEIVKNTYKQLALKTHPDKNPGNEDATARFQRLSEAYNVLVKHLDRSSSPPGREFATSYDAYDEYEDFDNEYYGYDEYESDSEEGLDFYMFLFEQLLRGKASRHLNTRHRRHPPPPPETPEQYQARARRIREEQELAEARRVREEASRRAMMENEREKERKEAEERQKRKAVNKKAHAAASQKTAEKKAHVLREQLQKVRSDTFIAARSGDVAKVKKGIWEDNVDAAGGEVREGSEAFVKSLPQDTRETLMHIAARRGDVELVQWLDSHSADPEERDMSGLTAFHAALQCGHIAVARYFFDTYPPADPEHEALYASPESKSLLRLAIDSSEPEAVWMILDTQLATDKDMDDAWTYTNSEPGKTAIRARACGKDGANYDEICKLLSTFGGFVPSDACQDDPKISSEPGSLVDNGANGQQATAGSSPSPSLTSEGRRSSNQAAGRGRQTSQQHSGQRPSRRPYRLHQQPRMTSTSSPSEQIAPGTSDQNPMFSSRGRGRRRGRGRGRGRGGRGQPPA